MLTLKRIFESNRQFILYGVIGCGCATLDFFAFVGMLSVLGADHTLWANVVGVLCGIAMSFYLNRRFNFKVRDNTTVRFISFLSVGLMGMALSTFLLYVFIDLCSGDRLFSKFFTIFVVAVFQFILNKYITFKTKNNEY